MPIQKPTGAPIWGTVKEESLFRANSSMVLPSNEKTAQVWKALLRGDPQDEVVLDPSLASQFCSALVSLVWDAMTAPLYSAELRHLWCLSSNLENAVFDGRGKCAPLTQKGADREKSPDHVTQLVRVPSWHTKVAGPIPLQGTHKNQPMNAPTSAKCRKKSQSLPPRPSIPHPSSPLSPCLPPSKINP